jgi:putrescine transport system permease protein
VATLIIVAVAVCVTIASILLARAERRRAAEISAAQRSHP